MTTKLRRGEELSRAEKNRLYEELQHNSYSKKGIPLQGWMFDFGQWLKEYFIEFTYGQIEKVWAIDKTSIRAYEHNIKRIVEIDNNF